MTERQATNVHPGAATASGRRRRLPFFILAVTLLSLVLALPAREGAVAAVLERDSQAPAAAAAPDDPLYGTSSDTWSWSYDDWRPGRYGGCGMTSYFKLDAFGTGSVVFTPGDCSFGYNQGRDPGYHSGVLSVVFTGPGEPGARAEGSVQLAKGSVPMGTAAFGAGVAAAQITRVCWSYDADPPFPSLALHREGCENIDLGPPPTRTPSGNPSSSCAAGTPTLARITQYGGVHLPPEGGLIQRVHLKFSVSFANVTDPAGWYFVVYGRKSDGSPHQFLAGMNYLPDGTGFITLTNNAFSHAGIVSQSYVQKDRGVEPNPPYWITVVHNPAPGTPRTATATRMTSAGPTNANNQRAYLGANAPQHCVFTFGETPWTTITNEPDAATPRGPVYMTDPAPVGGSAPPETVAPEAPVGDDECGFKASDPATWLGAGICELVKAVGHLLDGILDLLEAVLNLASRIIDGIRTLFVPNPSSWRIEETFDAWSGAFPLSLGFDVVGQVKGIAQGYSSSGSCPTLINVAAPGSAGAASYNCSDVPAAVSGLKGLVSAVLVGLTVWSLIRRVTGLVSKGGA